MKVIKSQAAQPRANQTCFAAEDAARFAKFGYNQSRVRSQNAGWLRKRWGVAVLVIAVFGPKRLSRGAIGT